ncbi:NAD(P)H-hydrate dehydratase [Sphingomonas sp. DT-204]|uniref:NAD(P)H-hydrate dehydratase n=1 Tax=Sphingomonas sp. DT-204 TaxID=3396166 RepID=UPI003F1A6044
MTTLVRDLSPIDAAWRAAHPLPDGAGDKEQRGRLALVGGSTLVPGALRLTAEAALRVGAGKVRCATVAEAAMPLGVLMPEVAMIALPADAEGEIAGTAPGLPRTLDRCDALVLGCAMRARDHTPALVDELTEMLTDAASALLDAGALAALRDCRFAIGRLRGRLVLTPHHRELAALTGEDEGAIGDDPAGAAQRASRRFGAVVALKARETVVAAPDGTLLAHSSDAPGLGTAGSGDVLAGVIGGLLARGADPLTATAWGVWLHGEAGQAAARRIAPTGFLARDLLPELPPLLPR